MPPNLLGHIAVHEANNPGKHKASPTNPARHLKQQENLIMNTPNSETWLILMF